jgi:quinol monooxygenase YgiN
MAALQAHFAVPDSRRFVGKMRDLSPKPIEMKIFDAVELAPT